MGTITDADGVGRVRTWTTDVDIVVAGEHVGTGLGAHCDVTAAGSVGRSTKADRRVIVSRRIEAKRSIPAGRVAAAGGVEKHRSITHSREQ